MVLRRCAVISRHRLMASAVLAGLLAGCTPPPPPPPPPPVVAHKIAPPHLAAPPPAHEANAFRKTSILFYQPDAVLKSRLTVGQAAFTAYVGQVERQVAASLAAAPPVPGFSAAIVIALKPGGESHAWLVTKAKLAPGFAAPFIAAAQAVPPVAVQGAPVAFAIVFNAFGGGGPPVVDAAHPIPIPREWHRQIAASPSAQGPQQAQ
jgi:hypothetical protein